jgi:hypothetical protein
MHDQLSPNIIDYQTAQQPRGFNPLPINQPTNPRAALMQQNTGGPYSPTTNEAYQPATVHLGNQRANIPLPQAPGGAINRGRMR